MRFCRYNDNRLGVVRGDQVHDVTDVMNDLPSYRYPAPLGDALISNLDTLRPKMEALADKVAGIPIDGLDLLSPVANPTKIMGTPQNYKKHVDETFADANIHHGKPKRSLADQGLFLKANSALVGPSAGVTLRFPDRRTDHEAELGVIIGKVGSEISEADALDYVAGYAIALDMVVRGPEDRSFRKSVDSYAVLGPWFVTRDEISDPQDLNFNIKVSGEIRQQANTKDMILSVAKQIAWASEFYTLHPGDILMSGTCEGVSQVKPGDEMVIEFDGVGTMVMGINE
ncbi:MAG: fumarylacetoacetate hydrolase family protein [Rhodospirillaceae bacterium]|jgi:2-keto-4-pentenoate hydratase/2-oxohepta-3-ene-1,7-dioic acid hydratase in catechol pathway|nr:fumarylacetoacetate hydrolase family protein [Rhodospirillales bacterium]MBT4702342.1 fumarylacetoacetate hydrolase family protein [Rhodospirillaceae bacterium]MBT5036784.1 fumarylacetoacetate hydrolase family protein [Rhodospirillaceae bacterium]MBT6364056.1 fumarylacetoacetate hydrolase family protein [Rhodospirillaceae bacterium]MBT7487846.1 fumarylacetoacetate hydrolase family protein [Rhodospirillales bacterium]